MKSKRFPIILGVAVAVAVAATLYVFHTNDLGLTGFYILLGGHPKMDTLRANTRATADTFLAKHKNDLVDPSDAVNGLAVDYSKSAEVRARGYRSSFYYYCWDIYLPYSLRTQSGKTATILVHLTDAIPGNRHDSMKFHVIDVRVLDPQGSTTRTINGI